MHRWPRQPHDFHSCVSQDVGNPQVTPLIRSISHCPAHNLPEHFQTSILWLPWLHMSWNPSCDKLLARLCHPKHHHCIIYVNRCINAANRTNLTIQAVHKTSRFLPTQWRPQTRRLCCCRPPRPPHGCRTCAGSCEGSHPGSSLTRRTAHRPSQSWSPPVQTGTSLLPWSLRQCVFPTSYRQPWHHFYPKGGH